MQLDKLVNTKLTAVGQLPFVLAENGDRNISLLGESLLFLVDFVSKTVAYLVTATLHSLYFKQET